MIILPKYLNLNGSKKSNVKAAIGSIKTYLKKLNKVVPF